MADRIAAVDPAFERFQGEVSVVPARVTAGGVLGNMLTPLLAALAGVVAIALLAAAVNVANLLLARATRRSHELGIRAALGAGRTRLGRLLALRSAVLACPGLAAGFLLSTGALHGLGGLRLPGGVDLSDAALHLDGRLLLLASAAGIRLVRGKGEALREPIEEPLLVVNEAMAARYWPEGDPIDGRVQIMDAQLPVVAGLGSVSCCSSPGSPSRWP